MPWTPGDGAGDEGTRGWGAGDGGANGWNDADENSKPNGFDGGESGFDSFGHGGPGSGDNSCRNCGGEGHFARECPEPRRASGACFNCGEEGHNKSECTKPRVFKGLCRICNEEGHPAAECPQRPPDICRNCKAEGHKALECKENRRFDLNGIPDKLPEDAWAMLKRASDERDLGDFREGLKIYSKAVPQATFVDIEKKMREEDFNIYLIAVEKPIGECMAMINLQGKLGCQYVVGFYFSPKAQRATLRQRWPPSAEENLQRLEDAGLPYDRQVPKCSNCGEMGHTSRGCKEERAIVERVEVKCVNCSAVGHRARDCPEPRRDQFTCRNCGSREHRASDCPEPRSAGGVECRKCNEVGHFAKDCPQASAPRTCRNCGSEDHIARECDKPRDVSTVTCRNCDETGHFSQNCPKPRDYSRVKCNNCNEMGHTARRCTVAETPDQDLMGGTDDFGGGGGDDIAAGDAGGWGSGGGGDVW